MVRFLNGFLRWLFTPWFMLWSELKLIFTGRQFFRRLVLVWAAVLTTIILLRFTEVEVILGVGAVGATLAGTITSTLMGLIALYKHMRDRDEAAELTELRARVAVLEADQLWYFEHFGPVCRHSVKNPEPRDEDPRAEVGEIGA